MEPVPHTSRLHRALDYPYAIPDEAYLLTNTGVCPLAPLAQAPGTIAAHGRRAIIAAGSNGAPEQLERKFGPEALREGLIVTRAVLHDYDSVYCAHFSRYGAIPATLYRAPAVRLHVPVVWLNERQCLRMHESEALGVNYAFRTLHDARLEDAMGRRIPDPGAYIGLHGVLRFNAAPVCLAAFRGEGRLWPALDQRELSARVCARLAPKTPPQEVVLALIEDEALRKAYTNILRRDAFPSDAIPSL